MRRRVVFFDHGMEAIGFCSTHWIALERGRPIMKKKGSTGNLFAVSVGGNDGRKSGIRKS